jgi:hypothetical protein
VNNHVGWSRRDCIQAAGADTMRFWSLRLREVCIIKSDPRKLLARGTSGASSMNSRWSSSHERL